MDHIGCQCFQYCVPFMKYLGHIVCALHSSYYIMFAIYLFRKYKSSDHKMFCLVNQSGSVVIGGAIRALMQLWGGSLCKCADDTFTGPCILFWFVGKNCETVRLNEHVNAALLIDRNRADLSLNDSDRLAALTSPTWHWSVGRDFCVQLGMMRQSGSAVRVAGLSPKGHRFKHQSTLQLQARKMLY